MKLIRAIAMTVMILSAACARPHPIDVMSMPATCDTVPPAGRAGVVSRVPSSSSSSSDRGAIVGMVSERNGGQPVPYGDAMLIPVQAPPPASVRKQLWVGVDSLGGFVLPNVTPGSYTLRIRAINHRFDERRVEVRSGGVDTVRVALRYYACHGY